MSLWVSLSDFPPPEAGGTPGSGATRYTNYGLLLLMPPSAYPLLEVGGSPASPLPQSPSLDNVGEPQLGPWQGDAVPPNYGGALLGRLK